MPLWAEVPLPSGGVADPTDNRPVYRQVADALRARIAAMQPGALLPAEKDLAYDLDVGLGTLRDALALLVQEGLVERQRGHRTRVRRTPPAELVDLPRGALATVRRPTDEERARLKLAGGELVVEVDAGGEIQVYGSDRVVLHVPMREQK